MNAIADLFQITSRAIGLGFEIVGHTVSFGRWLMTPRAALAVRRGVLH